MLCRGFIKNSMPQWSRDLLGNKVFLRIILLLAVLILSICVGFPMGTLQCCPGAEITAEKYRKDCKKKNSEGR
jgi:hypothetical protein